MGVDIDENGTVVLSRRKEPLNEVVKVMEHKKVVKVMVDEDTGDALYEHIGVGAGGVEWHTGVFVVEKGCEYKRNELVNARENREKDADIYRLC